MLAIICTAPQGTRKGSIGMTSPTVQVKLRTRPSEYAQATQLLQETLAYLLRLPAIPTNVELARKLDTFLSSGAHAVATEHDLHLRQTTVQAWASSQSTVYPLLDVDVYQDHVHLAMPILDSIQRAQEVQERTLVARLRRAKGETLRLHRGPRPTRDTLPVPKKDE
jgi:hypothetical protein